MNRFVKLFFVFLAVSALFLSCSSEKSENLVVYSPMSLEFIAPIQEQFEKATNIKMEVIALGTGEALKRIESEKNNPLADVLWSGAVTSVKPKMDLFENYKSPNEQYIDPRYQNVEGPLTRFDATGSIMIANTKLLGNNTFTGYADLLKPEYKGKIAMADPAASSSAFEHLETMLFAMGGGDTPQGWDYVKKFCAQLDGKLLDSSSKVYKGVADGEYTVGLTFEEGGVTTVKSGAPVQLVYMVEGVTFRGDGIEIIKGAKNLENAKIFLDFCTSKEVQHFINEAGRRTVRTDLPASTTLKPLSEMKILDVDEDFAATKKQEWISKFKEIFANAQ
jgi:iron(III) transport system substrate-binding protein